ncbi:hypothetical protein PtA15_12A47 [Puccinia triticina]|uniref:Nudix hydrolase domain-containing protein n=1 Tax=Puccinia triticina TaxID=208348 RepID=A0ABY7D1C5_9BASI|nr:uncharacterized protein PtA15_12A47 [Puccinia triticina]WAQ90062.1 hypothetical protein PtA15_12A47 [Puccinia triticina]
MVRRIVRQSPRPSQCLANLEEQNYADAGETALPGGKMEPQDLSLEDTARREAHEECGITLNRHKVRKLATLSSFLTRGNLIVTPIVFFIADQTLMAGSVYESYNINHLSKLTAALQQPSFCPPIFSVQVDAPGNEVQSSGQDFFTNDPTYFDLHQHQSQISSEAMNLQGSSNNLYDPINVPYLFSSQPEQTFQST